MPLAPTWYPNALGWYTPYRNSSTTAGMHPDGHQSVKTQTPRAICACDLGIDLPPTFPPVVTKFRRAVSVGLAASGGRNILSDKENSQLHHRTRRENLADLFMFTHHRFLHSCCHYTEYCQTQLSTVFRKQSPRTRRGNTDMPLAL